MKELVGFEDIGYSFTYFPGELAMFNGLNGSGIGYWGAGRFNKIEPVRVKPTYDEKHLFPNIPSGYPNDPPGLPIVSPEFDLLMLWRFLVTAPLKFLVENTTKESVNNAVKEGVEWAMNENKLNHLFAAKHNLIELVTELGGEENTIKAVLNAAIGKLPADGVFENIAVSVSGTTVYISGNVINGIPYIGTMYIP